MKVYKDIVQGSEQWHLARLGMPTASRFKTVMAKGRGGEESKTREQYLYELADELYRGAPTESYRNHHMERGNALEAEALEAYSAREGVEIQRVGFVRRGDLSCGLIGASPDAFVGDDGGVEVKTLAPWLMFKLLEFPDVPSVHLPQLHGLMLVTGRKWWDIAIYSPGYDLFVRRVDYDKSYAIELTKYLGVFNAELAQKVQDVTRQTITTWRMRREQELLDRIREDGGSDAAVELGEPPVDAPGLSDARGAGGPAATLQASLRASLEQEGA